MTTRWHTAPIDAGVHPLHGWVRLPSGVEITARPLVDETGAADWARLTYRDALAVAARLGGRLPTRDEVVESLGHARIHGRVLRPVTLSYGPEMVTRDHAVEHDRQVFAQLAGAPSFVGGIGKHWIAGAAPGKARICGWPRGGSGQLIQAGVSDIHDDQHHDYATTTLVVREPRARPEEPPPVTTTRPTIRRGDRGPHVGVWQRIIGAAVDERFGPGTDGITRAWQRERGLVADGIVGAKSWALAGETWAPSAPVAGDPRSPAAVAALRDANARWPGRRRASDGIMGDARHQLTQSGHNSGNAVDITHDTDPTRGPHGDEIRRLALQDPRTAYVIWNGRITNPSLGDRIDGEGRAYTGSNPHRTHVHIEVKPSMRADPSPWPWAP